jgi:hypothetical protein
LRVILRREFVGLVEGEGAVIRGETAMVSKIGGRRSGDVIAFLWRNSQIVRVMVDVEVEAILNCLIRNERSKTNAAARTQRRGWPHTKSHD